MILITLFLILADIARPPPDVWEQSSLPLPDLQSCGLISKPGGRRVPKAPLKISGHLVHRKRTRSLRRIKELPVSSNWQYCRICAGRISALQAMPFDDLPICKFPNLFRCRSRAASTRACTFADGSPKRSSLSFLQSTRGTSMWISMRSSIGPEMRPLLAADLVARDHLIRAGVFFKSALIVTAGAGIHTTLRLKFTMYY